MNRQADSISSHAFPRICIVTAIVLAAASMAAAQPSVAVTFGRALNSMSSLEPLAADGPRTTGGSVEVEQKVANERLRIYDALDAGDYNTTGDWKFLQNEFGATWQIRKTATSGPLIFAGASATWRSNGASWAAADYRGIGGFLNAEWKPAETRTFRAGYRFDARRFPDMAVLDQLEHDGFGSALVNLPSRTTLIGEVHAGAKRYDVLDATLVTTTVVVPSAGLGGQNGRGAGVMSQVPSNLTTTTKTEWTATDAVGGTAGLVSVLGRVAQSLADRTGASLQVMQRTSFGALPTAVITTPALFFDDGVYDDPYASNALDLRASLKHLLQNGMKIEAAGAWTRKDYRGTLALDLNGDPIAGDPLRADRIWRAGASWTIPILRERTGPWDVGVTFDYLFTHHHSNDAYYNYSSHGVGLSVAVGY
jgi:hypothetical protein